MKAYIKALSYYLPKKIVTNDELVKDFPEWSVKKVADKVGILQRHIASDNETASDLAVKAAKLLFSEYGIPPKEIDFVMLCTQSPDYFLPSTACIIQNRLGISTSSGAFDFNLGCSGCIYGLALAKSLVVSGTAKNVLLLTSETYNKYIHTQDKVNRSIFGDGAAACLVSEAGFAEIGDFVLGTDGNGANNLIVKTGAARYPSRMNDFSMDDEGHIKASDYLYMNGSEIFNFTIDIVPRLVDQILLKHSFDKSVINYYLFHQANSFILNTIRKVCAIPKEKFYINMESTGNTVSSTVFIGLKECIKQKKFVQNDYIMIAGFGVGLSWGGTIIKYCPPESIPNK